jgi:hypothetical protein
MICEDSIVDVKAEFVLAVRTGIETLMTHRGYSRERATNALIREFNRGADASEGRPNDDDVSSFSKLCKMTVRPMGKGTSFGKY